MVLKKPVVITEGQLEQLQDSDGLDLDGPVDIDDYLHVQTGDGLYVTETGVGFGVMVPDCIAHLYYNDPGVIADLGADDPRGLQIENANTGANTFADIMLRCGDSDAHISAVNVGTNTTDLKTWVEGGGYTVLTHDGKFGIGVDPSQALDLIGSMELENTTTSTTGVIYKGSDRFIHDFSHPTGNTAVPEGLNTFVGIDAGNFTMGGTSDNTGASSRNTGVGHSTLYNNTEGFGNTAAGVEVLYSNTEGINNTAAGEGALYYNTLGDNNLADGSHSLYHNISGDFNVACGARALYHNTYGASIVACGYYAGAYATGDANNETSTNSVYLGAETKAFADGDDNEIVIGYDATGIGSNSVVLGNSSVETTVLRGDVGIGTDSPFAELDVNGDITLSGEAAYRSPAQLGNYHQSFASKEYVYNLDKSDVLSGHLTHIDSDDQGGSATDVWGDGKFIYLANYGGGLHVYSVDGSGTLTHLDSDDQGGLALRVWGDGKFIYLANYEGGLHVYSVDDSGILTHLGSDDQGGEARGVWGDGKFIYLANYDTGLHVYSVDNNGILTHLDSDDQGDTARDVWGDGKFIYLANHTGGLHVYSVDDSGTLTHLDSDDQGGWALCVWGDGKFIYLANYDIGLHVYSVDNSGTLTHLDSDDQGDYARGVWGDGKFIYLANHGGGLHVYSVDDKGILTHIDSDDQGDDARSVWGDGKFIYLANRGGGLHVYSVDKAYEYDQDAEEHIFRTSGLERMRISSDGNITLSGEAAYRSPAQLGDYHQSFASKEYVYNLDKSDVLSGHLTHIDSDDQGDNAYGVWGDGKFIYLANYGGGLHVYSVDNSGTLTHLDSDDQGDTARDVWGDGKFIYLANDSGGLHVYSVDNSGVLTHLDSDDQGGEARSVWGDGRFVYLANYDTGLHVYSVDNSGTLTHLDSDDQGDVAIDVWGDGKFIYLANHTGGLHVYSISDNGILTHVDSDDQGDGARGVWGDGKFIYLANFGGGLHVYSVDNSGALTHLDSDDQGGIARAVWGDGKFIYLANDSGGLHVYSVNNSGVLTHLDSDDQGDDALDVWGDGRFVYLVNDSGGLHVYSVDKAYEYDQDAEEHIFRTSGLERMRIDSSGYVGIGTDDPERALHIAANPAVLLFEDLAAGTNDKRAQLQADAGRIEFNARNDDLSSRTDNILVMDMGTGDVGIGTNNPDGKLNIGETTNGSGVYWTNPAEVSTTDGTETTLDSLSTVSNALYHITATIVAVNSDFHDDGASYVLHGTFKNDGGTLTQIGTTSVAHNAESDSNWDAKFDVSGTDVRARVTGVLNRGINWHCSMRVMSIS